MAGIIRRLGKSQWSVKRAAPTARMRVGQPGAGATVRQGAILMPFDGVETVQDTIFWFEADGILFKMRFHVDIRVIPLDAKNVIHPALLTRQS